jgi:hypothetical protein
MLNQHACVLNRHAARYGNNAVQSFDSTRMDVIVFFKQPQLCACSLGLCLYCNKVVQHATCENHTHECENQMQRAKITLVRVLLPLVSKVDWFWTFSWTSNNLNSLKFESGPNRENPKDFKNFKLCTALLPYRAACRYNTRAYSFDMIHIFS